MTHELATLIQFLAYIGIIVGLIGTVVPVIPGPILIWLSILAWAWADGFEAVGWPTLVATGLITAAAMASNLLFSTLGARKGGASIRGLIFALVGAIVGLIVFSLPGALLGTLLGLLIWETIHHRGDLKQASRAGRGMVIGYMFSTAIEIMLAITIVIIFFWQVLN